MFWTASKPISLWFIWREKEEKGNKIQRSTKVIADICLRKFQREGNSGSIYLKVKPVKYIAKDFHESKRTILERDWGKRHDDLQPHNWRASCSGTCCQLLPNMEKFISLTSRSHRRQINSQKRHLIGVTWNILLYLFRNLYLFVF